MRAVALAIAAVGLLVVSSPAAAARTADYSASEAQFAELAANLGVSGFRSLPERGTTNVVLEDGEAIDHRLAILGISCRAWKVDNPLSLMVKRALTHWDANGDLVSGGANADEVRVRLEGASSTMRCVQVKELKMRCLVTASLSGTATRIRAGATSSYPIAIDLQQEQRMSGPCNGLAQGSSLIGRAASLALVDRLAEISTLP